MRQHDNNCNHNDTINNDNNSSNDSISNCNNNYKVLKEKKIKLHTARELTGTTSFDSHSYRQVHVSSASARCCSMLTR